MQKFKIALVMIVSVSIVTAAIAGGINVTAASYSGSGTATDPFIITNAEQLQGMRDNLSGNYKLGNTIDLSGVAFKPVGRMNEPFKGSFICEANADGSPKYIIKNLSIRVEETAYISERASKWESAMFGATDGATISGIFVLDANIINNNFGDNTGAVQYGDYKPGMGDMPAGILVGEAVNSVITNCGVSGTVNSRTNSTSGFIGMAQGSTIDNCWCNAEVISAGLWQKAGFCSNVRSSTFTKCAMLGKLETASSGKIGGGFTSDLVRNSTFTDCYSTCSVDIGRAFVQGGTGVSSQFTNCFAIGDVATPSSDVEKGTTCNNCHVLANKTNNQKTFNQSTMDQIKQAFSGLENWDVSGEYPTIKGMVIITDASSYVPGAVSETPTSSSAGTKAGTKTSSTVTQNGETTSSVKVDTNELAEKIKKLPDPDVEGGVSVDCLKDAMEAVKEFESLTTGEKEDFDTTLSSKLLKIRYQLSMSILKQLVTDIKELPEADKLEEKDYDKVKDLYEKYNFLDDSVKAEIDESFVKKLQDDYDATSQKTVSKEETIYQNTKLTTGELIYVIACSVISLVAVTFSVISCVSILRKKTEIGGVEKVE